RWARAGASGADVTISLTPYVRGDVDLRVGPHPLRPLGRAVRSMHPVRVAVELLHAPWALQGAIVASSSGWRPRTIGAREGDLGLVSLVEEDDLTRDEVRTRLGIDPGAFVVLTSACPGDAMTGLLRSAASRGAVVVSLGAATHSITEEGRRVGASVIALTHSTRMASLLDASDVCASTAPGTTMRLVADAVRRRVPVLAPASEVGAIARASGVTPVHDWSSALDVVPPAPTGEVMDIESLARRVLEPWTGASGRISGRAPTALVRSEAS
ncbi:MAG: hypothetical protein KDA28_06430, partial [Phycisphaerales bacterium]|nr:hypothetical protein [Phycisphaerales bacterium]